MGKIETIIKKSLKELKNIAFESESANPTQESKLIFPKKRKDESKRISEQEARFLLARELESQESKPYYYYSIETPTENIYQFSEKNEKIEPKIGNGQSASVDLSLYTLENEKFCRKHLIEFKQGNVGTCKKDFLKLLFDTDGLYNFYVNILNRDNLSKRNTLKSIINKYQNAIDYLKIADKKNIENKSILKIILFNIKDGDLRIFEDIDFGENKTEIKEKSREKLGD